MRGTGDGERRWRPRIMYSELQLERRDHRTAGAQCVRKNKKVQGH